MIKAVKKFVNIWEVDLREKTKNERFYDSLVRLVSILFAVVFGVALSQLSDIKYWSYDFFVLVLAYLAVILSWWGYHWGIIVGPKETNVLNYLIDCFLLIVYWHLLYRRSPLTTVLGWYIVMFLLYLFWELIRICKEGRVSEEKKIIRKAAQTNLIFLILISLLFIAHNYSW